MLAISTIWRGDSCGDLSYYASFWQNNLYHFEFLAQHHPPRQALAGPLKIVTVALEPSVSEVYSPASEVQTHRDQAIAQLNAAAEHAYQLKAPYLIIWPGSIPLLVESVDDHAITPTPQQLEKRRKLASTYIQRLCRSLFTVAKKYPDLVLAVPPARSWQEIPFFEEMEWIGDDLRAANIGYWHNTASCHLLKHIDSIEPEAWLNRYRRQMIGIHLEDVVNDEGLYPPGTGEINFAKVAPYMDAKMIKVLRVASRFEFHDIKFSCEYLADRGLISL